MVLSATSCGNHSRMTFAVSNPSDFERNELAEIPLEDVSVGAPFRLLDSEGTEIPYQITSDSLMVFNVALAAGAEASFVIEQGEPTVFADTVACGGFYPERIDDFAWENDRAAYRAYGPALQARGEHAYGYDVWTKSVAYPVVAERYRKHLSSPVSYHEDHGDGMDVYNVGPTLGGGALALVDSVGALVYPRSFATYEILDNGPLRFAVRLVYPAVAFEGDSVTEERVITLDAHSDLNRTEVRFHGLDHEAPVAAGMVVHSAAPEAYAVSADRKALTYADPTDNIEAGNGTIWLGLIAPEADTFGFEALSEPVGDAIGHVLARGVIEPDSSFTYYWGSGWSKGFVADEATWQTLINRAATSINEPLKLTLK